MKTNLKEPTLVTLVGVALLLANFWTYRQLDIIAILMIASFVFMWIAYIYSYLKYHE